MGERGFDRVGMGEAHNDTTRMPQSDRVECSGHTHLHLGERLAIREPERARRPLNGRPFGFLHEVGEFCTCPVAEVAFDEALVDDDALPQFLCQWRCGFTGAFEG